MPEQERKHYQDPNRLLRLPEVLEIVPVKKSTWWKWVREGKAPAQVRLGRCSCWKHADILTFIEGK